MKKQQPEQSTEKPAKKPSKVGVNRRMPIGSGDGAHSSNQEREPVELTLIHPGVVLFGVKCSECGGRLYAPKAGFVPTVCGSTCRMRKSRRLRKLKESQP